MAVRVYHGDDSDSYRFLIAEVLPAEDIEVVGGAGTPEEVVEEVGREQPDVVLLDQIGGAELIKQLREVAPSARVIVMSGYHPGDGDREVEKACDGYLVKTADIERMRAAVRGA